MPRPRPHPKKYLRKLALRKPCVHGEPGLDLRPYQVILRPLVTEKGTHQSTRYNAYAFQVHPSANKTQIKDAVEEMFDAWPFVGVPVVDAEHRLVGLIRRSDLMEALAERADSDYRKSQGIVGGEELRSMPVMQRALRRLSWLSVNIVLNVVAAMELSDTREPWARRLVEGAVGPEHVAASLVLEAE